MRRLGALPLAAAVLGGCQPQGPRHPELAGRSLHLSGNMSFNQSGDATDANHGCAGGTVLPLGTPHTLVKDAETDVWLQTEGSAARFHFVGGKIAAVERGAAPTQ